MRYAVAAIQVLQTNGQAKLALEYAYIVLRTHFSELEAHKAYITSLMPNARPVDIPVEIERVELGSAVLYSEGASAPTSWFVIEDTLDPSTELEELSLTSPIAQELLGKKVGDTFILAKSSIKDRVGAILKILSKYTRRFQDCMNGMQIRFGDASLIQSVEISSSGDLTKADIQPILDSVRRRAEEVASVRTAYKDLPISLHVYGEHFGQSAFGAVMDLASTEIEMVKCADGTAEVLQQAIGALQSKSTVVVELSALATLRLLGIEKELLQIEGLRFVMSQSTAIELQNLRAETCLRGPSKTMFFEHGKHYLLESTEEAAEKYNLATQEWLQYVEKTVTVMSTTLVANLAPERREELDRMFGRYGLEAAILASSPGHVLWTDDLILGVIATKELGAERIWTQALLEYLASVGTLSRSIVDTASARLLGFNYIATHFNSRTMIAAFELANWAIDGFPARQVIAAFRQTHSAPGDVSFRMFAESALLIFSKPLLPETRCLALRSLLDTFPDGLETHKRLKVLRQQIARLLAPNRSLQQAFTKCCELWERERFPFVSPA